MERRRATLGKGGFDEVTKRPGILISLILAAPVLAQPGQPVFMPAGGVKWTDLDPKGAPGVQIADLWGDHTKGLFGAFLKLRLGSPLPFTRTRTP